MKVNRGRLKNQDFKFIKPYLSHAGASRKAPDKVKPFE
jgi:hypothetical protein